MADQAPASWGAAGTAWSAVDDFLTPIRIPLFFFISALLVQGSLARPWAAGRKRVIVPAYLYVLWSTLLTLRLLLPWGSHDHSFLGNLIGNLMLAGSGYWYLYALPLYFVYAKLTRRWPWWVAVIPLLPGLAFREPLTEWTQAVGYQVMDSASLLGSILANGIFYWIGARYGRRLIDAVQIKWTTVLLLVTAYTAVQGGTMILGIAEYFSPITSLLGIGVGVALASTAPSVATIPRGARYVGQRTLPVYVLQFFFISVLSLAWSRLRDAEFVAEAGAAAWIYPVAIAAAVIAFSLISYSLATRTKFLAWLFSPPHSWTRSEWSSSPRPTS